MPNLMKIVSFFLKLQAVKQSGPGFCGLPRLPCMCVCVCVCVCAMCREKKLTFVVVDPLLTAVLRPHQREVILTGMIALHLSHVI